MDKAKKGHSDTSDRRLSGNLVIGACQLSQDSDQSDRRVTAYNGVNQVPLYPDAET